MAPKSLCFVDGCDRKSRAGGMCNKHYERQRKHGDPMFLARPWKYDKGTICLQNRCDKPIHAKNLCANHYRLRRRADNIQDRLADTLRARMRYAIRNSQKKGSAVSDLACSIDLLKEYLEDKFTEGMSWTNFGLDGWHIDHIKPLSAFDLSSREEFLEACHYTNQQPMWARDNLKKD